MGFRLMPSEPTSLITKLLAEAEPIFSLEGKGIVDQRQRRKYRSSLMGGW